MNNDSVAFYEYSNRIINIPKSFVIVISTVLFPRICYFEKLGNCDKRDYYVSYAYVVLSFISFASIFGILSIGKIFAVEYYGEEFASCGDIILCLVPLVFIIGLGDIIKNSYILPQKKEKYEVIVTCTNALINIGVSALLIPFIGIFGAVVGTLIAEIVGLIMIIFFSRKDLVLKDIVKPVLIFGFVGIIMYKALSYLDSFVIGSLMKLIIMIGAGAIVYIGFSFVACLIFYRESVKSIFLKFKRIKK